MLEPAALEAREDLAGQPALHRVGLDQHECPLDRHRRRSLLGQALRSRRGGVERLRLAERLDAPTGSTGVSQYGQTCQSASSGCLQLRHACRSRVVQTGQTRKLASTSARQTGQCSVAPREPLLHRLDLELALAHVLEVLGRPEEHVDRAAPTNGGTSPSTVAIPTSHGSSIRRRASL